ncbi:MAG TPA: M12 family metallopeptidase [Polyangiaceae bacterium]|nr:M12 family metallopeptidase [Polyangiaceae bacterium]
MLLGAAGTLLLACTSGSDSEDGASTRLSESERSGFVNYRGVRTAFVRRDGALFIEGDIEVGPADLAFGESGDSSTHGDVGRVSQAVRRVGATFRWPNAVVGWNWDTTLVDVDGNGTLDSFTAAQQTAIQQAMTDWSRAVPGLSFQQVTTGDRILFRLDKGCSSPVGRQGGAQIIRLTGGCVSSFSVHHEIAHSLGIFHEQSRADRNSFVTINWANIKGCTATATGPTVAQGCGGCSAASPAPCGCTAADFAATPETCNTWQNFVNTNPSADVFNYDLESVMHYPADAFQKAGFGNTITVIGGGTIGQRIRLSSPDRSKMRVLYPSPSVAPVIFAGTGNQRLCLLNGREDDASVDVVTNSLPGAFLNTNSLTPGTTLSATCTMKSALWAETYTYPNAADISFSGRPASEIETYSANRSVPVLSAGLIPIFAM